MANGNGDARNQSDAAYDAAMSARRAKADDRNPGSIASTQSHSAIAPEMVKYPAPMAPQVYRPPPTENNVGGPQEQLTEAQKNKLSKQSGHTPIKPPVKPTGAYP